MYLHNQSLYLHITNTNFYLLISLIVACYITFMQENKRKELIAKKFDLKIGVSDRNINEESNTNTNWGSMCRIACPKTVLCEFVLPFPILKTKLMYGYLSWFWWNMKSHRSLRSAGYSDSVRRILFYVNRYQNRSRIDDALKLAVMQLYSHIYF